MAWFLASPLTVSVHSLNLIHFSNVIKHSEDDTRCSGQEVQDMDLKFKFLQSGWEDISRSYWRHCSSLWQPQFNTQFNRTWLLDRGSLMTWLLILKNMTVFCLITQWPLSLGQSWCCRCTPCRAPLLWPHAQQSTPAPPSYVVNDTFLWMISHVTNDILDP